MAGKFNKVKVVTGKVRFAFPNVFVPVANEEGGDPKYSICLLIPKTDKENVDKINKAIEECKKTNAAFFGGSVPKVLKGGLRDGDAERDTDRYPEYAGNYFINANSFLKPGVVDAGLNPLMDKDELYSGCYGRVSLNFFPYNGKSSGIAAGLANVQKLEDGEKLGGGATAAADFAV